MDPEFKFSPAGSAYDSTPETAPGDGPPALCLEDRPLDYAPPTPVKATNYYAAGNQYYGRCHPLPPPPLRTDFRKEFEPTLRIFHF